MESSVSCRGLGTWQSRKKPQIRRRWRDALGGCYLRGSRTCGGLKVYGVPYDSDSALANLCCQLCQICRAQLIRLVSGSDVDADS